MGVWADLLIGDGFWLGFVLINSLIFVCSSVVKYFGYLGGIMAILMCVYYIQNLTANTFEWWGAILMGASCIFHFILAMKD